MYDVAYYRARAEAKAQADTADLQCVRARCLRAAEAWTAMAERVEATNRRKLAARAVAEGPFRITVMLERSCFRCVS
jgi:hypothetical protein